MKLTSSDEIEILRVSTNGHQASDLLPVLRKFAADGDLDKIPEAISLFSNLAQVNRAAVRRFLAARVPAIIMNHYWPEHLKLDSYHDLVRYFLEHNDWAEKVIAAVEDRQLQDVVDMLQDEVPTQAECADEQV